MDTVAGRTARAKVKFVKIAPRKVRLVLDAIRKKPAGKAFDILFTLKKKAARITEKLLKTGVANAKVLGLDENRLYISDIRADGGPVMKRIMQRSQGRAETILKRTSHISLVLTEGERPWKTPTPLLAVEEGQPEKQEKPAQKLSFGRKKKAVAAKS